MAVSTASFPASPAGCLCSKLPSPSSPFQLCILHFSSAFPTFIIASMASASRRRMPLFTLLGPCAFIAALLSGVAAEAPVRYSSYDGDTTFDRVVSYGDKLFIRSSILSEGGVTSEATTAYQRLTGNYSDPGSIFTLLPASDLSDTVVRDNDEVYVSFYKLERSAPEFWGWQKNETEFFLQRTFNPTMKFKIIAMPFLPIWPPLHNYALISSPGSYASGLSGSTENGVTYIKHGEEGSNGDLLIQFQPYELPGTFPRISMRTDT